MTTFLTVEAKNIEQQAKTVKLSNCRNTSCLQNIALRDILQHYKLSLLVTKAFVTFSSRNLQKIGPCTNHLSRVTGV